MRLNQNSLLNLTLKSDFLSIVLIGNYLKNHIKFNLVSINFISKLVNWPSKNNTTLKLAKENSKKKKEKMMVKFQRLKKKKKKTF